MHPIVRLHYTCLGADDGAGQNHTGQAAVDSNDVWAAIVGEPRSQLHGCATQS